ncbi:dephospho-CoA kinase [Thermotoga profunda]|uniref:dephospho-CoA kinase n=1 Tax=Thermotoga profunda TaxID=1508420 RepID=UPI000596B102|nr:dephospho-CoA kinase [Thermotoga profunda]
MKLIIGLTGKIGSGKSTVAQIFRELGAHIIDVDKIGHEVLQNQEVKNSLREIFGEVIFDGVNVDRKKLASIVFSDPKKLSILERITHPKMREKITEELNSLTGLIVIDAAILHRLKLEKLCDFVITVVAPMDKTVERLKQKGMNEDEIYRRLACQEDITDTEYVIVNDSDLSSLREKIKSFYNRVIKSKM